jgi:predicted exporter
LPTDVYVLVQEGPALEPLLVDNETLVDRIHGELPSLAIDAPSALLASDAAQQRARARVRTGAPAAAAAQAALTEAAKAAGFREGTLDPFRNRLPALLDPGPLTYDGYHAHRLGNLIDHFIVGGPGGWTLASYAYPTGAGDAARFERLVKETGTARLTGLPLVNRELAERFIPQFVRGLVIGSVIVVILIVWTFRTWRLCALAVTPTVVGLIWTAGLLAMAGVVMDLFALFAVVTFVGIGIDYGIHVVHRYRDHGHAEAAIAQLAPVIVVAGLITLLGYGTLVTSSYPPLRSIGIVSAVSVLALVAASLLVLPALLVGGRPR